MNAPPYPCTDKTKLCSCDSCRLARRSNIKHGCCQSAKIKSPTFYHIGTSDPLRFCCDGRSKAAAHGTQKVESPNLMGLIDLVSEFIVEKQMENYHMI